LSVVEQEAEASTQEERLSWCCSLENLQQAAQPPGVLTAVHLLCDADVAPLQKE